MTKKYRANAVDIWKRPLDIRYIYYVENEDGTYVGTTWNSFNQALTERGAVNNVKIVDIIDEEIMEIKDYNHFKEEWRLNYKNSEWKYSQ
jgi:3-methyladenine DNA glycosylase AlkD